MKPWVRRGGIVLAIAAATHLVAVWALPRLIMQVVISTTAKRAGGANVAFLPPLPDHTAREIVLPSPDLFYVICTYDVSETPLLVTAEIPDTYWSVAFYASNTDNFFVLNDRKAGSRQARVVLAREGDPLASGPAGERVIRAPSTRGVVLFRTLVPEAADVGRLDAARRSMQCGPLGA